MFKGSSTHPLDQNNFGVGSTIETPEGIRYLLVSPIPGRVTWLELSTFNLLSTGYVYVGDPNWLTEVEFTKAFAGLPVSRDQVIINTAGLK